MDMRVGVDNNNNGVVYEIIKSTHHSYHHMLRRLKRDEAKIIQHDINYKLTPKFTGIRLK